MTLIKWVNKIRKRQSKFRVWFQRLRSRSKKRTNIFNHWIIQFSELKIAKERMKRRTNRVSWMTSHYPNLMINSTNHISSTNLQSFRAIVILTNMLPLMNLISCQPVIVKWLNSNIMKYHVYFRMDNQIILYTRQYNLVKKPLAKLSLVK